MMSKRRFPPGWTEAKFGKIATFKNGANFSASDRGVELKMLGVGDFQDRVSLKDTADLKSVHLASQPAVDNFLEAEDLVFVRSNGSKELVGRCLHIECSPRLLIYSGFCIRARLQSEITTAQYVNLLMQRGVLKKQLIKDGRGTNISNLNQGILDKLNLLLPPRQEQKAITALLSIWDEAIEKTDRLIQAKEKQLNGLYQHYFVPESSNNMHWEKVKIGRVLKPRNKKALPSEDRPLFSLTIEDGVTAKTDRYNREALVKDNGSKKYKIVCPNDIVFNPANLRWGAIARSMVPHEVVISPIYEVLSVKNYAVDIDFISHLLTCPRQIGIYATKTEGTLIERMAVKLDAFLLLDIYLPPEREEQQEISNILNAVQHEIDLLKQLADKYKNQKRGLMQKMLTGEWRVKPEIVNQYMEA